jgi:DNA (cytosine-5)-methyltransferase 1
LGGFFDTFCPEVSPALMARDAKEPSSDGDGAPLIAHSLRADGFDASEDGTGRGTPLVPVGITIHGQGMQVRRLTPEECEALQGFPRGYTKISDKTADGPRYRALGNSMAVPCMAWIGKRIQMVEEIA